MKKSHKINARITPAVSKKLQEIVRATGSNMSEVIMQAIEAYYHCGSIASAETPYAIAQRMKVMGCARGPRSLSSSYKDELPKILRTKYGHR